MKRLILASQSPRRKELLEKCGVSFDVEAADIDECIDSTKPLREEIAHLSLRKAETILESHPDAVVIGSDTVVAVDNHVMGKPKNKEDAARMLRMLSGNTHQVVTGIAIVSANKVFNDAIVSDVVFHELDDEEIERYIDTGEPMDKAGSYAIQGIAGRYIKEIHGDFYAIMGLPLSCVYEELKNLEDY